MNNSMTYRNYLCPRDRDKLGSCLVGYFAGSLSNILKRFRNSMLMQATLLELIPCRIFTKFDDAFRCDQNIQQIRIIAPHK